VSEGNGVIQFDIDGLNTQIEHTKIYTLMLTFVNPLTAKDASAMFLKAEGFINIAATELSPPPPGWHTAFGVAGGSRAGVVIVAAITSAGIFQTNPLAGSKNYLYVNIRINAALTTGSRITVRGLRAEPIACNCTFEILEPCLEMTPCYVVAITVLSTTDGSPEATWRLLVQNAPSALEFNNPPWISGSVEAGVLDPSLTEFSMCVQQRRAVGVLNGTLPSYVVVPTFSVLTIEQTSCFTASSNSLDIALQMNFDLPNNSTFTIHGLYGVDALSGSPAPEGKRFLNILSTPSNIIQDNLAVFYSDSATATMTTTNTLLATTTLMLSMSIKNKDIEQRTPGMINCSVRMFFEPLGSNTLFVPQMPASAPSIQESHGIRNGKVALVLIRPIIIWSVIYQSNPLVRASNSFTVNFTTNVRLTPGSTISIVGLDDSATPKSGFLELRPLTFPTVEAFGNVMAEWVNTPVGIRVQTRVSSSSVNHSFAFELQNGNYYRSYTPISISGSVNSGVSSPSGTPIHSPMAAVTMSVFRELRQGVPDGSLPLYVVKPSLQTKVMAQSNPIVGLLNTLTVTIAASSNVPMGSLVTLQGLTGIVNHPESFPVTCSPPGIRSGALYTNSPFPGTVLMYVGDQGLMAKQQYVIEFSVTNSAQPQSAPPISVCVTMESGKFDSIIECTLMDSDNLPWRGIPLAKSALFILMPGFVGTHIEQTCPLTHAANTITIRFMCNMKFDPDTYVYITDLSGIDGVVSYNAPDEFETKKCSKVSMLFNYRRELTRRLTFENVFQPCIL
jgi:hypothetical protein